MNDTNEQSIGDVIAKLFDEYLQHYEDEALASVAAAATMNDILNGLAEPPKAESDEEICAA